VHIWVSPDIRADHARLSGLIIDAFQGVRAFDVLVRVERAKRPALSFAGRAYPEPSASMLGGMQARYLVRLLLPSVLRNRAYPKTYRYARRATAPWITVGDWRERVIALAAHEAYHVHQFREGLRRSEVQAERWAAQVLLSWRERELPAEPAELDRRPRQLSLDEALASTYA
jgi:hypothetical protein